MTCQKKLREQGLPYPRTCQECCLGPCKYYPRPVSEIDKLRAELAAEREANNELRTLLREARKYVFAEYAANPILTLIDAVLAKGGGE